MKDIAMQMLLHWARADMEHPVTLTDDFTKLTLDAIALCTMDYRFNSFYTEKMHPFIDAMIRFLNLSQVYNLRNPTVNKLIGRQEKIDIEAARDYMLQVAQGIIDKRRANPTDEKEMLNTMLYGKDPRSGESMRDELVGIQMVTFLIAGHETTSGALSFLFSFLLQNPDTYLKLQQEVDEVVGIEAVQYHHLKKLKYTNAALREALRLMPTAPYESKMSASHGKEQFASLCGGKYTFDSNTIVRILIGKAHRDTRYFGEDAQDFVPWRMHEDNPDFARHMKCFKAFGNGSRSCIGQHFAWQEAILVTAMVMQNFDMDFAEPGYKMTIKQSLTIKPANLKVKLRLRKGLDPIKLEKRLHTSTDVYQPTSTTNEVNGQVAAKNSKMTILYGTNQGTCQALAQRLASTAASLNISATVADLNSAVNNLPVDQPIAIIVPSYEGQPPENATRFVSWLENSGSTSLMDVKYAVFGCGHRDWSDTFHRIPKLIDSELAVRRATRFIDAGFTDTSNGTVIDDFIAWQKIFLSKITGETNTGSKRKLDDVIEISTTQRAEQLSSGLALGTVKESRVLTGAGEREKRHLEVELPENMAYEVGDYLAVLPVNPDSIVDNIMRRWGLPRDATITLRSKVFGEVPVNTPLSVHELLKQAFELSQPISKAVVEEVLLYTTDESTRKHLMAMLDNLQTKEKYTSLFQLLQRYPLIKMPFGVFLTNMLPLRVRLYSISSSPLADQRSCSISYSVVKHVTQSAGTTFEHEGVATNFLASLKPGDKIQISVKTTATANSACPFRPPTAAMQATTPLLMFCAGTGLAPFRGFVQHRALMLKQNPKLKLAPALLFVGCRSASKDRIYTAELEEWQQLGAVDVRYAFSTEPEHELAAGCKHIGDRVLKDIEDARKLWLDGARAYVCGSRGVQNDVKQNVEKFWLSAGEKYGWTQELVDKKKDAFLKALSNRGVSDIFD